MWFEHDKGLTYAGLHLRERRCIRRELVPIRSLGQCLGLSEGSRSKQYRWYPDTLGIMERNVLGISHEVRDLIFRFIVVPSFPYLPYFSLKSFYPWKSFRYSRLSHTARSVYDILVPINMPTRANAFDHRRHRIKSHRYGRQSVDLVN